MSMKLMGLCLILVAGTWLGFAYARTYEKRLEQLRELTTLVVTLKNYVEHVKMPVAEALLAAAKSTTGLLGRVFHQVAQDLTTGRGSDVAQLFSEALEQSGIALKASDKTCLILLAGSLETIGRRGQEDQFALILSQLKQQEQEAFTLKEQNVKMYRYLGICGSLTVVILLV